MMIWPILWAWTYKIFLITSIRINCKSINLCKLSNLQIWCFLLAWYMLHRNKIVIWKSKSTYYKYMYYKHHNLAGRFKTYWQMLWILLKRHKLLNVKDDFQHSIHVKRVWNYSNDTLFQEKGIFNTSVKQDMAYCLHICWQ